MTLTIRTEDASVLPAYATVSAAFPVSSRLRARAVRRGLGGFSLVEEPVTPPWVKDYDAGPEPVVRLADRWDVSRWGFLAAFDEGRRVGGAVVARPTPGLHLLENRDDLCALWDLRVHPDRRRQGVGSLLFASAAAWGRAQGCRDLVVETQDVNVPACRFYARQGCRLRAIDLEGYRDLPDEAKLLWTLALRPGP